MKKITILALCLILAVGVLAGCRRNVATETGRPTATNATTMPTTAHTETTSATETTRHTAPTETTNNTMIPGTENGTVPATDGTDTTGQGRHMPPRY